MSREAIEYPAVFRLHRGSLADSLATRRQVASWSEVEDAVLAIWRDMGLDPPGEASCRFYGYDPRIDRDVWVVTVGGAGTGFVEQSPEGDPDPALTAARFPVNSFVDYGACRPFGQVLLHLPDGRLRVMIERGPPGCFRAIDLDPADPALRPHQP